MIIALLIDYLSEVFAGMHVGTEAPEEVSNYIILEQTGSQTRNHLTTTTVAIQTYGASNYDAMIGNEAVKDAMQGFLELPEVSAVRLDTDYNFTDTETKQYRYQAVYNITHYLGGF